MRANFWQRARPYLEQMPPEGRDQQEEKSSQPPKLSAREPEAIEFVDSQEPALPEGNKKHVVVQENWIRGPPVLAIAMECHGEAIRGLLDATSDLAP